MRARVARVVVAAVAAALCLQSATPTASGQDSVDDAESRANAALAVFTARCAKCHGTEKAKFGKEKGDFGFVDDITRLAAADDYIDPGKAESSALWTEIKLDRMPPGERKLEDGERKAVFDWIEGIAANPDARQHDTMRPETEQVTNAKLLRAIRDDLASIRSDEARRSTRYFTLSHLWNAGLPEDRIERTVNGLVKLVNSLTWSEHAWAVDRSPGRGVAAAIRNVLPQKGVLLRVDLESLRWTTEQWEALVNAPYPYGILFGDDQEDEIRAWTGSRMAYLRADWFIFEASKPPLYHTLLSPSDSKQDVLGSDQSIERYLGIDVLSNIRTGNALRAGFRDGGIKVPGGSGVSSQNRVIERHAIPGRNGAYWKSYDFKPADENPQGEIIDRPLGPVGATESSRRFSDFEFRHNGGEIIWNLPNGMQAYLLVDAHGRRIDEGPTDIVFDTASATSKKFVIVNGISCMSCHISGMKNTEDAVTKDIRTVHAERVGVRNLVDRLYRPDELREALARDGALFLRALDAAGVPRPSDDHPNEPVVAARKTFEDRISASSAAAELGFTSAARFVDNLGSRFATIRDSLRSGARSTIARQTFKGLFPEIVAEMRFTPLFGASSGSGKPFRAPPGPPVSNADAVKRAALSASDGDRCRRQRDIVGAQTAYQQALELDSRCVNALKGMSLLCLMQGQESESLEWLSKAANAAIATLPSSDRKDLARSLVELPEFKQIAKRQEFRRIVVSLMSD